MSSVFSIFCGTTFSSIFHFFKEQYQCLQELKKHYSNATVEEKFEYLFEKLRDLKNEIKPLKIKAAYQQPCSSRLSPDKYHLVGEIFDLIGAELVEREYQGENALCCGEVLRMVTGYEVANDVQKKNVDDMVLSGAEYCVFNCPYCQMALSEKVSKRGIKPIHIIDLCKMAIGEK